jgi:trehalose 6-phosphate phosphatase
VKESDRAAGFPAGRLEAAIFDMDGVITRTARLHAAAWKEMFDDYLKRRAEANGEEFQPFDEHGEYRRYVDGKPRYDGVRSFLESRGISLPEGNRRDPPDRETVCGLGNRKNGIFRRLLDERGVETYDSSIAFIRKLKSRGLRVAVISASKNAEQVLRAAGVLELFDVKVDGVDAQKLNLAGKPAPDIFVEAADRLEVKPERAAVVEDAQAGVEAGHRGGFGFVVGVDRDGQAEALKQKGADLVVEDLAEVRFAGRDPEGSAGNGVASVPAAAPMTKLPSPLDRRDEIRERLRGRRPAVFLDYDGTLTPIVNDPDAANLSGEMRDAVRRLAELCPLAVVSGRDLADVRRHVNLNGIYYAGSHGFDILSPEGESHQHEQGKEALPALDRAERTLRKTVDAIEGARLERKRFALAVHFRQVRDEASVGDLESAVDRVAASEPKLRKTGGKKIYELRPAGDWDKGKAVLWLMDALGLDGADVVPIYVGDDVTDEDAFRTVRDRGLGIAVGASNRNTLAHYVLGNTEETGLFLRFLIECLENGR